MAPLVRLLALLALSVVVLASPHVARNVYSHAHRAVARPDSHLAARDTIPIPRRQRALNRRQCIPRPTSNSTTIAIPSSTATPSSITTPSSTAAPSSAAPINVAPVPSLATSSSSASSDLPASSPPSPSPTTSNPPSPTSEAPAPTTSTPPPPPPPTTSTPPPAQTSSSSSNSGEPSYMRGTQIGQGTWFDVGLGACGITNNNGQNIAAVAESLFDSYPGYDGVNPNLNPVCGKQIKATYLGKSVTVTVTDRCTACQLTDLDFSPNAFDTLADPGTGRININWDWI